MKHLKIGRKNNERQLIGKINNCQICGSAKLAAVINLDHQPPCDLLPNAQEIQEERIHYPINVARCVQCGLVQLDYIAPPNIVFHKKYPYRTGITKMLVDNFRQLAEKTVKNFKLEPKSLVVDIGSNDGTALKQFKNLSMRVVGVEPTDVAKLAQKDGMPTINDFFSEKIAAQIAKKYGPASLVIATNTFAHINNLSPFLRGVHKLLKPGGVFISESQYLLDTIQKAQYDTMYHEHLRFYSLKPMRVLFKKFGFTLTDAERISSSGGSIRVFAIKGRYRPLPNVAKLIKAEERFGLYKQATYEAFRRRVELLRLKLVRLLCDLKLKGKIIVGVGSPGRSSPIINYCHLDPLMIPYIAEQATSLKLGLYTPGTHVPIIDEKQLFVDQPEYALLFSWHIADDIIKKLRSKGLKSKFILPLPEVKIVK